MEAIETWVAYNKGIITIVGFVIALLQIVWAKSAYSYHTFAKKIKASIIKIESNSGQTIVNNNGTLNIGDQHSTVLKFKDQ